MKLIAEAHVRELRQEAERLSAVRNVRCRPAVVRRARQPQLRSRFARGRRRRQLGITNLLRPLRGTDRGPARNALVAATLRSGTRHEDR